jgi:EF hand
LRGAGLVVSTPGDEIVQAGFTARAQDMAMRTLPLLAALLLSSAALAQPAPDAPPPPGISPAPPPAGGIALRQFQDDRVARMMAADTDHDGLISKAEWTARLAERQPPTLGGMGGRGTPADAREHHFSPDAMFDRLDANHDGYLDRDEIAASAAQRFARMDRNSDGVLTPDEMPRWGDRGGPPPNSASPPQ